MGETNPQALMQGAAGPSPHALRARAKKPILFGKYELLERFRIGGMAEVWTAKRLGGGEPSLIAIKRILPSFTDEADYLAMFRDEARLAERLSHPNIVATLEVGQVDDHPYIALEHVRGQHVAALIRKVREQSEAVPAPIALRIAIEVCRALEHAHSLTDDAGQPLQVVHRDVSPTNILLGYDGSVKLIDFGIAKSNDQLMRTQAGLLKGKHGYLSPEQAAGEPIDARSDLFSLAICAWEMLAGKRLFLGASDFSSIARVREAVVPPLDESGAPSALEQVLRRALSREPEARHGSATELREAFEQASGEGVAVATDAELATYLSDVFADELTLEASSEALDAPAPYEGTGLLDAFDDLEPVSTVSTLAVMPDAPDEPAVSAAEEEDQIDEDLDLMEVSSEPAPEPERFELMHEPEADTESDESVEARAEDDSTDLHKLAAFDADGGSVPVDADSDTTVETSQASVAEAVAEMAAAADVAAVPDEHAEVTTAETSEQITPTALAAPDASAVAEDEGARAQDDEEQADEPTRVVAYRSLESGEVGVPAEAAAGTGDASPAAIATLPGMGGVEWDDEELSTHLYDGPSAAVLDHPPAPIDGAADEAVQSASGPAISSRPSVAPFSAKPGTPQFVLRPQSVPPAPIIAPAPTTHRPPVQATPVWLLPALIVGVVVVGAIAFSMLRSSKPGTIHLTTQPPDTQVTFDGRPVESSLSPFVIASVAPDEHHAIAVSRDGYRTWQTQIVVSDGQTLQLPEIVLVPMPAKSNAVAAQPAPSAEAAPLEPAKAQAPSSKPVDAPSAPRKVAAAVRPDSPAAEPRAQAPRSTATPAPARPRAAAAAPAPVAVAPPQRVAPAVAVAAPVEPASSDTGMLRVNSRPWAQVHVDGRLVGNTPQMALRLSPGRHTVLLLNPELKLRKTFTVQVKRGSVTTKIVELMN